jgi:arginyl-tRNA synthetase
MSVFKTFRFHLERIIRDLQLERILPRTLPHFVMSIEPPREESHGDISTNIAMVLSKVANIPPRQLAQYFVDQLSAISGVASVEIAGPGFINLRLSPDLWLAEIPEVLRSGHDYGKSNLGNGQKVNVEYVSANPTGPLHVGHVRGAVFGDALASLLSYTGHHVTREYYINDAGTQVQILARSAYLRYREVLGEVISIPEGLYPGDYLIPVAKALVEKFGSSLLEQDETQWLPIVREFTIDSMMVLIREDLAQLSIHHDVFTSEKDLHESGKIDTALSSLTHHGLIYQGVLEPPKGKILDDWEPRPQTLFKSTEFGDDVDRALKKSDGTWTYFASDIAYHRDKFDRGFTMLIDVWGADHGGYIKRMKSATNAITQGAATLNVQICQLVHLYQNGEPYRMSKRAGTFVTLKDILSIVSPDVVRFMMLTRKNDAGLDFDFSHVLEQSKDNPVFYVQYAYARISSVLRTAQQEIKNLNVTDSILACASNGLLTDYSEISLVRKIAQFPRVIEQAAEALEPHRIVFYLEELAALYHAQWNKGKENPALRFIIRDNIELTCARLALIRSVSLVISAGLNLLGVRPIEEM